METPDSFYVEAVSNVNCNNEHCDSRKVDHPKHYTSTKYECVDVVSDLGLNFELGNTVKYIWRAGKKSSSNALEDLKKAAWYLDYEIKKLEREQAQSIDFSLDDNKMYYEGDTNTITLKIDDLKIHNNGTIFDGVQPPTKITYDSKLNRGYELGGKEE